MSVHTRMKKNKELTKITTKGLLEKMKHPDA